MGGIMRGILALSIVGLVLAGCAELFLPPLQAPTPPRMPVPPVPPRTSRQSLEMAVNTDPVLNFNSITPIKDTTASTFAVMDFGSPVPDAQQSGAGISSADTFYISLSQRSIKIIERERIKRIAAEQDVIRGSRVLSDQEKAQRIGRLAGADFMIFGAVTEYKSEVRDVELGMFIPENERQRYETDYQAYQRATADYQQGMAAYMRDYQVYRQRAMQRGARMVSPPMMQQQRPPEMVKSLEQWEDEVTNRRSRRELATVAYRAYEPRHRRENRADRLGWSGSQTPSAAARRDADPYQQAR